MIRFFLLLSFFLPVIGNAQLPPQHKYLELQGQTIQPYSIESTADNGLLLSATCDGNESIIKLNPAGEVE